ncbi:hypothetical protein BV898_05729 [Hypsibius exemplaris]|uniref:Uncharacterized protein n=1 Tax=Hypsibius exemplaris TaxID=2072580 RepID=A0A1W0WY90_HYPEX|nr:hypothetical protein BV898_05729 [Hypsibius exemplaris]
MPSGRSKLSAAKSLPDLHRSGLRMPASVGGGTAGKPAVKSIKASRKTVRKPPILPYREDQYSSKVLTGTWQERRSTDHLPKVPFQDAYMLDVKPDVGRVKTTEVTTYQKNYLPGQAKMNAAIESSYRDGKEERTKNKKAFHSETTDDVYHPAEGTTLHDQGAAWHSLYHQSYTLRNPKGAAGSIQLAAVGAPEVKYGLWEKHLSKWAKMEADSNIMWKSTYQTIKMGYPVRVVDKSVPPDERRFLYSQWRTQEGNVVIGNPHAEAQKEMDSSVSSRHERPAAATATTAKEKYRHGNR